MKQIERNIRQIGLEIREACSGGPNSLRVEWKTEGAIIIIRDTDGEPIGGGWVDYEEID